MHIDCSGDGEISIYFIFLTKPCLCLRMALDAHMNHELVFDILCKKC